VVVDYVGTVDGKEFEGGQASDSAVELGAGRMLQSFEQGLVGTVAGSNVVLEVTFPESFRAPALAGKQASFQVTVHRVEESHLPEVDAEFARSFGVADGGVDEFRQEVRNNLERELDDAMRLQAKGEVMDALLQAKSFELPSSLVEQEKETIRAQHRQQLRLQGLDPEGFSPDPGQVEDQAHRRVGLGLLLAELVKSHDIKPDQEQVRARITSIASTYEKPDEIVRWYYDNRDRLKGVESAALEEKVVDWVLERADVTEEKTTFDALVNPGQTTKP
jgi:trigger factor